MFAVSVSFQIAVSGKLRLNCVLYFQYTCVIVRSPSSSGVPSFPCYSVEVISPSPRRPLGSKCCDSQCIKGGIMRKLTLDFNQQALIFEYDLHHASLNYHHSCRVYVFGSRSFACCRLIHRRSSGYLRDSQKRRLHESRHSWILRSVRIRWPGRPQLC